MFAPRKLGTKRAVPTAISDTPYEPSHPDSNPASIVEATDCEPAKIIE